MLKKWINSTAWAQCPSVRYAVTLMARAEGEGGKEERHADLPKFFLAGENDPWRQPQPETDETWGRTEIDWQRVDSILDELWQKAPKLVELYLTDPLVTTEYEVPPDHQYVWGALEAIREMHFSA